MAPRTVRAGHCLATECSRKAGSTSWVIPGSEAGLDRTVRDGGEGQGGTRGGGSCRPTRRSPAKFLPAQLLSVGHGRKDGRKGDAARFDRWFRLDYAAIHAPTARVGPGRLWPISLNHPLARPEPVDRPRETWAHVYPLIPAVARPKSACSAQDYGSQGSSGWSIASRWRCSRKSGSTSWVIPGSGFPGPMPGSTRPAGTEARAGVVRGGAGRAVRRADHLRSSYLHNF